MKVIHELKLSEVFFDDVRLGRKSFEVRFNDRNYVVGDVLHFICVDSRFTDTGSHFYAQVFYVYDGPIGLKDGFVVLGIKLLDDCSCFSSGIFL